jgi:hypothetical protein
VTARQVLDFLVEKKLIGMAQDATGGLEKKAYATGSRSVRRWIERNGYQRGRRKGNLVLRADIAVKRNIYLQEFFKNRKLPRNEKLREVYLDESYIHEHYHRFDDSLWDRTDDQDVQIGKMKHKGCRYCFFAAIQGTDPRLEDPITCVEKGGLVRGSLWAFCPQAKKMSRGDYHKVFNRPTSLAGGRTSCWPTSIDSPALL